MYVLRLPYATFAYPDKVLLYHYPNGVEGAFVSYPTYYGMFAGYDALLPWMQAAVLLLDVAGELVRVPDVGTRQEVGFIHQGVTTNVRLYTLDLPEGDITCVS